MKIEVFSVGGKLVTTNHNNREMDYDNIKFIDIACGSKHNLALSTKGQLFGWGKNSFLQTG